jgi:AraC-like ligand binding domain
MRKQRYRQAPGTVLNGYVNRYRNDTPGSSDRIRFASGAEGIERLEARLHGQAFSVHSHDTYAIGITLSGIQTFHFRGERSH